jgi:hypothetical protein
MSRSRCYDLVLFTEASSGSLHLGHIVLRGSLHGHEVDTGVLNLKSSLFQQVLFAFWLRLRLRLLGVPGRLSNGFFYWVWICAFGVDVVVLARVLDFSKACIKSICLWTRCDQGKKVIGVPLLHIRIVRALWRIWISLLRSWVDSSILTMLPCS